MENEVLPKVKEERNILHTKKKRRANWIGHILPRNCPLKHVFEGKMKGKGS
jgi:hypothetical protein